MSWGLKSNLPLEVKPAFPNPNSGSFASAKVTKDATKSDQTFSETGRAF